jgi:hypothetical protein
VFFHLYTCTNYIPCGVFFLFIYIYIYIYIIKSNFVLLFISTVIVNRVIVLATDNLLLIFNILIYFLAIDFLLLNPLLILKN